VDRRPCRPERAGLRADGPHPVVNRSGLLDEVVELIIAGFVETLSLR